MLTTGVDCGDDGNDDEQVDDAERPFSLILIAANLINNSWPLGGFAIS
jgi:hypothetical protein